MMNTKCVLSLLSTAALACTLTAGIGLAARAEEPAEDVQPPAQAENYVASAEGWDTPPASWSFSDGAAVNSGNSAFLGDLLLRDYEAGPADYTLQATFDLSAYSGEVNFGIVPWAQDAQNCIIVAMKWDGAKQEPFSMFILRLIDGVMYGPEGQAGWNDTFLDAEPYLGALGGLRATDTITMTVERTYNEGTSMDDYAVSVSGTNAEGTVMSYEFPVQSFSQSTLTGGKIGLYSFGSSQMTVSSFTAQLEKRIEYDSFAWATKGGYQVRGEYNDSVEIAGNAVTMNAESLEGETAFYTSSANSEAFENITYAGSLAFTPSENAEGATYGLYLHYQDDRNHVRLAFGADSVTLIQTLYNEQTRWTAPFAASDAAIAFSVELQTAAEGGNVVVTFGGNALSFVPEAAAQAEGDAEEGAAAEGTPLSLPLLADFDSLNVGAYAMGGTLSVTGISVTDDFVSYSPQDVSGWTVYGARKNTWTASEDGKNISNGVRGGTGGFLTTYAVRADERIDLSKGYFMAGKLQVRDSDPTSTEKRYGFYPYFIDANNYLVIWLTELGGTTTELCMYGWIGGQPAFTRINSASGLEEAWFRESFITFSLTEINELEVEMRQDGTVNVYLNRALSPTVTADVPLLREAAQAEEQPAAMYGVNSIGVAVDYTDLQISTERIYTVKNNVIINFPASFPTTGVIGERVNLGVITATLEGDGGIDPTPVITVTDPDNEAVELSGVRFTPEKAGTYIVTVTATDEWGNTNTQTREIVVTAEPAAGDVSEGGQPLTGGAIAGIVIAAVIVAAGIGVGVFFLVRKKKK